MNLVPIIMEVVVVVAAVVTVVIEVAVAAVAAVAAAAVEAIVIDAPNQVISHAIALNPIHAVDKAVVVVQTNKLEMMKTIKKRMPKTTNSIYNSLTIR
jgi:hypothetical protein